MSNCSRNGSFPISFAIFSKQSFGGLFWKFVFNCASGAAAVFSALITLLAAAGVEERVARGDDAAATAAAVLVLLNYHSACGKRALSK